MPIPVRTEDWAAPNDAEGIEPFVSNVLQIIERDQKAAHVWAGRGEELVDYQVFNNSKRLNQRWPAVAVIARREKPTVNDSGLVLARHAADVEIEVKGSDPNALALELMRRVRAVLAMIWAARVQDLTADMQSDFGAVTVEIGEVEYTSFIDKAKTSYLDYARIPVTMELLEH